MWTSGSSTRKLKGSCFSFSLMVIVFCPFATFHIICSSFFLLSLHRQVWIRHGRPQRGKNWHSPPLEIRIKKQKFVENLKSAS